MISWCVSALIVNALRGHLSEYGYVFPQGITHVASLVAHVEDPRSSLPESARVVLKLLVDTFTALEGQIAELDGEIKQAVEGRPYGTPADDDPRRRPDRLDGNYRAGAGDTLPGRTQLRSLARASAATEIDRR